MLLAEASAYTVQTHAGLSELIGAPPSAGDLTVETTSCAASPAASRGSALKIPRLHLSPAASANGSLALRLSPAPSMVAKVPPLRLSPAPSVHMAEGRVSAASGSVEGSSGSAARQQSMPRKVPALKLPGKPKGTAPTPC